MKVTIANNVLTIEIPLQTPRPSASGKTLVVATSSGNYLPGNTFIILTVPNQGTSGYWFGAVTSTGTSPDTSIVTGHVLKAVRSSCVEYMTFPSPST